MAIENVKCPDCNGDMVSRKSQYGTFWGCKAYPKCKGTRDSEGRSKAERAAEREKNESDANLTDNNDLPGDILRENDRFRFRKQ